MIKIMVDSASDLRPEDNIYDIMVPMTVTVAGGEYKDGVQITADAFYEKLAESEEFPKTSQPSPEEFIKHFEEAKLAGDEIIYISISSALSGTYQGAVLAKEMVEYDGIYIIDSLAVTQVIAVMAAYAQRLAKEGKSAKEIVEEIAGFKNRVKVFAGVDTLEYLKKGGRLSGAAAAIGTLAKIKPVVSLSPEGGVLNAAKALGIGKAMQFITDKLSEFGVDRDFPLYSLYTGGIENAERLEEKLKDLGYNITERRQVGPTIGAHVGPGVYGVVFVAEKS